VKQNTKIEIKQWMFNNAEDFTEGGELNMTMLAQTAAAEFNIYDGSSNIPESICILAFEVSEEIGGKNE